MKIAFRVTEFPVISQTFILNQIIGLLERGHEVKIYANRDPEEPKVHGEVEDYELYEKTTYIDPPKTYTEAITRVTRDLLSLAKKDTKLLIEGLKQFKHGKHAAKRVAELETLSNDDSQLIHYHFGNRAEDSIFAAKALGKDSIVSFYGYDASKALEEDPNRYENVFEEVEKVTYLNEGMKKKLVEAGCSNEKLEKVPLSVNTKKFDQGENSAQIPKILTVARFTEKKGHEYAVKALSKIEKEYEYHLMGDGELKGEIRRQVEQMGMEDKVFFHGWCTNEDVKQMMKESDIFLLPSVTASDGDREGTPTVLLEAQSAGLPVVSTRHAGIPEIVQHNNTGFLAEERDSSEIKSYLNELLNYREKRDQMGEKGRAFIKKNHSINKVSKELDKTYSELNSA
jgi:colanic acid/amylovoran biosynthesis glycosyltransferase